MAGNTAVVVNIAMFQGEDRIISDTIYAPNGNVQNISGWNVAFSMFALSDPSTVFVSKTVAGGGINLSDPTNGVLQVLIARADTISVFTGQYEYSVVRTDPGNDITLSRGLFSLLSTA